MRIVFEQKSGKNQSELHESPCKFVVNDTVIDLKDFDGAVKTATAIELAKRISEILDVIEDE